MEIVIRKQFVKWTWRITQLIKNQLADVTIELWDETKTISWASTDDVVDEDILKVDYVATEPPVETQVLGTMQYLDIDGEIHKLIKTNYDVAMKILNDNKDALDRIAEGLMVWETLDLPQIMSLINGDDIGVPLTEAETVAKQNESNAKVDALEKAEADAKAKENPEDEKSGDDPVMA